PALPSAAGGNTVEAPHLGDSLPDRAAPLERQGDLFFDLARSQSIFSRAPATRSRRQPRSLPYQPPPHWPSRMPAIAGQPSVRTPRGRRRFPGPVSILSPTRQP